MVLRKRKRDGSGMGKGNRKPKVCKFGKRK